MRAIGVSPSEVQARCWYSALGVTGDRGTIMRAPPLAEPPVLADHAVSCRDGAKIEIRKQRRTCEQST